MPDLAQSLQGRDLGHLRIIAQLWGLDWDAPDARIGLARIVPLLLDPNLVSDTLSTLPGEARAALRDLARSDGQLPWALFTRRFGQVREMGAARRDREQPHRQPASPAEILWYRALVARAFFDSPAGPQEMAYIPDDLLRLLPGPSDESAPLGRPATPQERAVPLQASDRILDHATTWLAALRAGQTNEREPFPYRAAPLSAKAIHLLLQSAGMFDESGSPRPDSIRNFLETPRSEALLQLFQSWQRSALLNELRLLPGLVCEGAWENDPRRGRGAALDFLSSVEADKWWSIPAFIADIRQRFPDFQRPAGDYDSWFIREEASGEFLRGFQTWDAVDGRLIRFLICGPLHWLGLLDLAFSRDEPDAPATAFRFSAWAPALLRGEAPAGLPEEKTAVQARSDGVLRIPLLASRAARYQLARFGDWLPEQPDAYLYRISPASLARARQQGLTSHQLLALLRRYADTIPPSLTKALARWEEKGVEARLETLTVLRLASPEVLATLRNSPAARFLGDPLSSTAVIVRPGAGEKLLRTLAELGIFGEAKVEGGEEDRPAG